MIGAVCSDEADAVRRMFVAVTTTRTVLPASAETSL